LETVFQRPENLKYPRIRQFGAMFLNTAPVGFVDPEARRPVRFVREGGGPADCTAPATSMDWPEFTEMIGVRPAPHRKADHQGDDAASRSPHPSKVNRSREDSSIILRQRPVLRKTHVLLSLQFCTDPTRAPPDPITITA
jgi:hypothetical protein